MKDELVRMIGEDYISPLKNIFPFVESYDHLERMWRYIHQHNRQSVTGFVDFLITTLSEGVVIGKTDLTMINITEVNKIFPNVKTHSELVKMYDKRYGLMMYEDYDIFKCDTIYRDNFIRYLVKQGVKI